MISDFITYNGPCFFMDGLQPVAGQGLAALARLDFGRGRSGKKGSTLNGTKLR